MRELVKFCVIVFCALFLAVADGHCQEANLVGSINCLNSKGFMPRCEVKVKIYKDDKLVNEVKVGMFYKSEDAAWKGWKQWKKKFRKEENAENQVPAQKQSEKKKRRNAKSK